MQSPYDSSGNYIGFDPTDKGVPFRNSSQSFNAEENLAPVNIISQPDAFTKPAPSSFRSFGFDKRAQREPGYGFTPGVQILPPEVNTFSQSDSFAKPIQPSPRNLGFNKQAPRQPDYGFVPGVDVLPPEVGGNLSPQISQLMTAGYVAKPTTQPTLRPQAFRPYSEQISPPKYVGTSETPQPLSFPQQQSMQQLQDLANKLKAQQQSMVAQPQSDYPQPIVLSQPASKPVPIYNPYTPQQFSVYNPFMGLTRYGGFIPARPYNPYAGAPIGPAFLP